MSCAAHGDVDLPTDEKGLLVNAMAMGGHQVQAEAPRRRIDGRLTAAVPAVPGAQESRFSPRIRTLEAHSSGKHVYFQAALPVLSGVPEAQHVDGLATIP